MGIFFIRLMECLSQWRFAFSDIWTIQMLFNLYDYFEYHQAYVLILERPAQYRDLFDFITERKRLNEHDAKDIFKQVRLTLTLPSHGKKT